MEVSVNSVLTNVEDGVTLEGLLNKLNIDPKRVAVELNLEVVKKKDYQRCVLKENDRIEIVHFVGGGAGL